MTWHTLHNFLGFVKALLELQKLRDVEGFQLSLGLRPLGTQRPRYAYVFPWAEALVRLLMIAGALI